MSLKPTTISQTQIINNDAGNNGEGLGEELWEQTTMTNGDSLRLYPRECNSCLVILVRILTKKLFSYMTAGLTVLPQCNSSLNLICERLRMTEAHNTGAWFCFSKMLI